MLRAPAPRVRGRRSRAPWALVACVVGALLGAVVVPGVAPASAATADPFDPGNIISDERFFDSTSMTANEVQSFLNARVPTCSGSSSLPCLKSYTQSTPDLAADTYCGAYDGAGGQSAAQIIAGVARACGINPQVILVLLEKEQGLVSSTSPTSRMYRSATGYGCPDTADCDTQYYGFFNQVYNAAHQFQRYTKTSGSWRYQPGRWNSILYHPNTACGASDVYIQNQATANLYIYTPYQPNAAALANPYGVGDSCSSYGNRNFWRLFRDWFGNPSNWLTSASFEGSMAGWWASNGRINRQLARDGRAHDGEWFFATNTPESGRAVTQDITRTTRVGEQAVASVWLRSSSERPFRGSVTLWGLGGSLETARTEFSVGPEWTEVAVTLPMVRSDHRAVRLDIYLHSTDATLWVDDASMAFEETPPPKNRLGNGSFESGAHPWYPGNGSIDWMVATDARAVDGNRFLAVRANADNRSIAQSITQVPVTAGERYTFSAWVRSVGEETFTGRLATWLFGPGGREYARTGFDVGPEWTLVQTTIEAPRTEVVSFKPELYLDDPTEVLWVDDAQFSPELTPNGSFESGGSGWGRSASGVNLAVYSTTSTGIAAVDGDRFAQTNTDTAGTSIRTDAALDVERGQTYRATVWVRAASSQSTFRGRLAIWALGGDADEGASVPFEVDGTWTQLRVELEVAGTGHDRVRLEVYEDSVGVTLRLDDAHLY